MNRRFTNARPVAACLNLNVLTIILATVVAVVFVALALGDRSARQRAEALYVKRAGAAAQAALQAAFARQDRVLEQLLDRALAPDDVDHAALRGLIEVLPVADPGLRGATIVDADGAIVAASGFAGEHEGHPAMSSRLAQESAAAFAAQPDRSFYLTRSTNEPSAVRDMVGLARSHRDAEGRIAAIALLAVDQSALGMATQTARADLGEEYEVVRSDGTPLFLSSQPADVAGETTLPAALLPIAGFPVALRYHPMAVDADASWRIVWLGSGALLAGAMIAVGSLMSFRERRHRRALLRAVRASLRKSRGLRRTVGELAAAARRADETNRAKSHFFALVTHELRTPLNAILGFSDVIRRELFGAVGDPRYAEFAGHVHEAGNHLLSLINDVLDMAKLEAGKMELAPMHVSATALARSAIDMVSLSARQRGVALSVLGSETCPDLYLDLRAGKQVLINLLSNAIKFTPDGGRIDLRFAGTPEGGVTASVIDSGIGMSTEDIAIAFEPFGQVVSAQTAAKGADGKGTGLGLPLARALVRLHGGELSITSQPGRGTTATAMFPGLVGAQPAIRVLTLVTADSLHPANAA